jgi:hypothetical protein
MRVLDHIVFRLVSRRVPGKTALLPELVEPAPPAGEDLVDVGLVPCIPDDPVARRFENPVQGDGELDDAEVRAEATAGPEDFLNEEIPDLAGHEYQVTAAGKGFDAVPRRAARRGLFSSPGRPIPRFASGCRS